jgi:hypothetical protein
LISFLRGRSILSPLLIYLTEIVPIVLLVKSFAENFAKGPKESSLAGTLRMTLSR